MCIIINVLIMPILSLIRRCFQNPFRKSAKIISRCINHTSIPFIKNAFNSMKITIATPVYTFNWFWPKIYTHHLQRKNSLLLAYLFHFAFNLNQIWFNFFCFVVPKGRFAQYQTILNIFKDIWNYLKLYQLKLVSSKMKNWNLVQKRDQNVHWFFNFLLKTL